MRVSFYYHQSAGRLADDQPTYQGSMDQQEVIRDLLEQELGSLLNTCAWVHHHGSAQQRQQCAALLATVRQ